MQTNTTLYVIFKKDSTIPEEFRTRSNLVYPVYAIETDEEGVTEFLLASPDGCFHWVALDLLNRAPIDRFRK